MEHQFAFAPRLMILLFVCGIFVAGVIGVISLARRLPAAGGVLLAFLLAMAAVVPVALYFVRSAHRHAVYELSPRAVLHAETLPLPPVAPGPPQPPGLQIGVGGGMTRILDPAEVPPTAESGAFDIASAAPVEAPRPSVSPEEATVVAEAPSGLPEWVKRGTVREGERTLTVAIGQQFADESDAWRDAVSHAATMLRHDFEKAFRPVGRWRFDPQQVDAIRNSYTEAIRRSAGENEFTVYRTYLQVELSPAVRHRIEPVWREQVSKQRSWMVGGLFAGLTALAAAVAGYFRLDDRTNGRYRWRLRLGLAAAMVPIGLALVVGTGTAADSVLREPVLSPPMPVSSPTMAPRAETPRPETGVGRHELERAREVADRMVRAINAADYEGVRRDFNPGMRRAFPEERCRTFFTREISGRFGRIQTLGPPEFRPGATASFAARCDQGALDFSLVLDPNGQVAGMLFRPRPGGTT